MLIAFDGVDGAGKSTQLKMFTDFLGNNEIEYYFFDMGGFEYTKKYLYGIKHDDYNCNAELRELLYYFEGRLFTDFYLDNYDTNSKVAICDRWTLTYLSYGQYNGISLEEVLYFTQKLVKPDLYFYLDIDPEVALERISQYRKIDKAEVGFKNQLSDNEIINRKKYLQVQRKIRNNFLDAINSFSPAVISIDGNGCVDDIHKTIIEKFVEKFVG